MKYILLLLPLVANAGGLYAEAEVFAFSEVETEQDYAGLSPFASYSLKYKAQISPDFAVNIGLKHQSSAGYKELGKGFNGPFFNFELKLF